MGSPYRARGPRLIGLATISWRIIAWGIEQVAPGAIIFRLGGVPVAV